MYIIPAMFFFHDTCWKLPLGKSLALIFCNLVFYPGRRAEEGDPRGIRKQTGHGSGNDAYRGGELSGPPCTQRQKMADLQDLSHQRHGPGRSNGMVGFTILSELFGDRHEVGIRYFM